MNKKIKIIELWNIIAQVDDIEKLPKKIKYYEYIYELQTLSRDYYCKTEDDYFTDRVNDKPLNSFLNDTVEILEDNTEEIEELETVGYITTGGEKDIKDFVKKTNKVITDNFYLVNKIIKNQNKLARAVNQIRKEKE